MADTVIEVLVEGPQGPVGAFGAIDLEMLSAGATPTASVTGFAPNQVLHLGIPVDESYTDEQIAILRGSAPAGRRTLGELSDAIDGRLSRTGGTMSGPIVLPADPTAALQAATKQYVDGIVAAQDAMVFKGVVDASTNPNYPAADRGWTYRISMGGKIGGGSGVTVEAGDIALCLIDGTIAGTHAAVGANWAVIQANLDGAVIGPAGATDGTPALFDGGTGRLLKGVTFAAFKVLLGLAKGDVGLGNVNNTSDAEKPVSTAVSAELADKVGKTGSQTIAGDLTLSGGAGWRVLAINAAAGLRRRVSWYTAGVSRWTLEANDTAEAGGNAGSDLEIRRYADDGTDLGVAWQFVRATGALVPGVDNVLGLGRSDRRIAKAFLALADYADDAAAATGGIAVGQLYRTGGAVKIRVA